MKNNSMISEVFRSLGSVGAELAWVDMVLPSTHLFGHEIAGEWDLKDNNETIFGAAWKYDADNAFSMGNGHTSFKSNLMYFEDAAAVGNYHAGYTGIYAGVPPLEAFKWAGLGEMAKVVSHFWTEPMRMWQWYWNIPPYGDQPRDYFWDAQGMAQAARELRIQDFQLPN
jgi:hypothetical protein